MKTFEEFLEEAHNLSDAVKAEYPHVIACLREVWDARQPEIDELKKEIKYLKIKLGQEKAYLMAAQDIIRQETGFTLTKIRKKIEYEAIQTWMRSLDERYK